MPGIYNIVPFFDYTASVARVLPVPVDTLACLNGIHPTSIRQRKTTWRKVTHLSCDEATSGNISAIKVVT